MPAAPVAYSMVRDSWKKFEATDSGNYSVDSSWRVSRWTMLGYGSGYVADDFVKPRKTKDLQDFPSEKLPSTIGIVMRTFQFRKPLRGAGVSTLSENQAKTSWALEAQSPQKGCIRNTHSCIHSETHKGYNAPTFCASTTAQRVRQSKHFTRFT